MYNVNKHNDFMEKERNLIFASNVKAERVRKNLTQFQLAELIGVSESTISLIERGLQAPSIYIVIDIARVLKINILDLLKNVD